MGWKEVDEIRRQSTIKKRGLVNKRNRDLKEGEEIQRRELKEFYARHAKEAKDIWDWFHNEMQLEAEYVADAIVGAQR